MKLTKMFIAALAFAATTSFAQEPQNDAAPQVDAATQQDAQDIYNRLRKMSNEIYYRTDAEYEKRKKSDQCAASNIALTNAAFREFERGLAQRKDLSKDYAARVLAQWQGHAAGQAAAIMIACDEEQVPPNLLQGLKTAPQKSPGVRFAPPFSEAG